MKFRIAAVALAAGLISAQAQDLTAEGRALIAAGISGDQFYDAMSRFRSSGAQEESETMLRLARLGHPVAIRVLTSECLGAKRCVTTPKEAHDMLAESAKTDADNAEKLGVVYRWGWFGDADPLRAAQWLKYAHDLGAKNVLTHLRDLPDEAVEQAGASHLLTPDEPTGAAAALLGNPDTPAGSQVGDVAGPTMLPWKENNGFPVFVDTAASDVGDAAMSCLWVLQKEANIVYDEIKRKDAAGTALPGEVVLAQFTLDRAKRAFVAATDVSVNGGLMGRPLDAALAEHKRRFEKSAASGPSLDFCETNLDFYILTRPAEQG